VRTKRTKQYTKEELENALVVCDHDTKKLKEYLDLGDWSLRNQLDRNGLYEDKRKHSNKKRELVIPSKEELMKSYFDDNLTLLEMGKIYGASNVTVKKWMVNYDIELLTHSQTISQKVVPKIIKTNQENFGYDHYFGSEKGKDEVSKIFIEKYGVPYHPIGDVSKAEVEVLEYFNTLVDGFKNTKIFGIELDGYNPNVNIAFEYCGIFWHKESIKGKDLHYKKYNICKDNGVRLFTIFEDEWIHRKEQVKSFIKASLNKNDHKMFARKLKVEFLNKRDIDVINFIQEHHIQGKPNINNCLGHLVLKTDDVIYSAMSFSIHHRNNKEIVLSRYCIKRNHTIIGGAQKLFKHAINHFKSERSEGIENLNEL